MSPLATVRPFVAAIKARRPSHGCLCIGLDPEPNALPPGFTGPEGVARFCRQIIEATADLVLAYKPNLAFFERWGAGGVAALSQVIAAVPRDIPVIADGKRGDIGNTSRAYAEGLYETLGAGACTVSPYLGADAVAPLLDHPSGFAFVLCRTSNPGAAALQDLLVYGEPLHAHVVRLFAPWLDAGHAGLVIGARERAAFGWAAKLAPLAPILVPGIGAQGGTVEDLAAALSPDQARRVVVSASRSIIHAGNGSDFALAAREAARELRDHLERALGAAEGADGDPAV
ncbi:MAG TPA: orotidine-5'-phosphate decarboxylase [Chloroflexota bacterium]|nr:orotidine-5'-phosphate decarboxylase [Chloroflexota bacterium]